MARLKSLSLKSNSNFNPPFNPPIPVRSLIGSSFLKPSKSTAHPIYTSDDFPLELSCRDVGADCDFVARGKTEEEIFKKAAEHGKKDHNMDEIPPELRERARTFIHLAARA